MCKRWGAAVGPHDNLALCCWPACQQVNSFAIALCVSAAFTTGDSIVSIAGLIVLAVHSVYIQGGFVVCSLDTRECSCRYVFVTSVGDLWRGGESEQQRRPAGSFSRGHFLCTSSESMRQPCSPQFETK